MKPYSQKTLWFSLVTVIFICDQSAKNYIDLKTSLGWSYALTSLFNLLHALNPGTAFSFLSYAGGWQRWFFLAVAFVISCWLAWMLTKPLKSLEALAYSLILGVGLGNAYDRAWRGHVIDYLDLHLLGWHWPAFNVADMVIVGGAILLVVFSFLKTQPNVD